MLQAEIEAKKEQARQREEAERKPQEERERMLEEMTLDDKEDVPGLEDYDETERMMIEAERDAEEPEQETDPFVARLRDEFPDLVSDDFSEAEIPAGWHGFAEEALRLFMATGMKVKTSSLTVDEGALAAVPEDRRESAAVEVLNRILAQAGKLCMICGRERGDAPLPVYGDCRKKYANGCLSQPVSVA